MEIPMMITEPSERLLWLGENMWNRFTDTSALYLCDSLHVNGVKKKDLDLQMNIFATVLADLPLKDGQKSMEHFYSLLDLFQRTYPTSNMLPEMTGLTTSYFYDPNSPVRSEDLYLPYVSRLATSELIDKSYRMGYAWDSQMCALNQTGSVAADFVFIDTQGKKRTLHSIKSQQTLLIFGNPDCSACKEIVETIDNIPILEDLIRSGELAVVDIFIDEEIDVWKSKIDSYPSNWINGYDPAFIIRGDLLYNVRAVPSIYLLDGQKRVILKDATPEKAINTILGY